MNPPGWAGTVAAVARETGFHGLTTPGAHVLVLSADGNRLIWASDAALHDGPRLLGRASATVRRRLSRLGAGLAPRAGFRLERLPWSDDPFAPPITLACRIVSHQREDGLMLAWGEALARSAPQTSDLREAGPDPEPEAPTEPDPDSGESARKVERLTWRADRDGRFTHVTSVSGRAPAFWQDAMLGRRWSDLLGRAVHAQTAEVDRGFSEGRGWSRAPVLWRDGDAGTAVPGDISGVPIWGEGGQLSGFLGFCRAFPEQAQVTPTGLFSPILSDPSSDAPSETRLTGPAADALGRAMEAATAFGGVSGDAVFGVLRAWFAPAIQSVAPPRAERAGSETAELTATERGALDEIARTLAAAGDDGPGTPEINPEPEPPASAGPGADHLAAILDELPVAVALARGAATLLANRLLLETSGYPDQGALAAAGGLAALLEDPLPESGSAPSLVSLRGRSGESRAFHAQVAEVLWANEPATLLSLVPASELEPGRSVDDLARALAEEQRRVRELSSVIEAAVDAVVMLDGNGRVRSLTRSAERLFGGSEGEVRGETLLALVAPEDHRAALDCFDSARGAGSTGTAEREVRSRPLGGGRAIPMAMRISQLPEQGDVRFAVSFRDVTEQKAAEAAIERARAEAERASANRADFLARVSHEIRTPLTAITGFAELMRAERFGPIGNERYKGYIQDIQDSGEHVISLVNDLLDLAKVTAGQSELSPERLDLNATARQCAALLAPIAARERAILRTSFAPGLAPAFADERSVRQVMLNVISNAIRFTGPGGQVIVSTARVSPKSVGFRVRDTGPGMTEDQIEDALTPFRQIAATRRGDGTGLGLPLSRALVEANGGVFALTSSPTTGTLIDIRLPAAAAEVFPLAAE